MNCLSSAIQYIIGSGEEKKEMRFVKDLAICCHIWKFGLQAICKLKVESCGTWPGSEFNKSNKYNAPFFEFRRTTRQRERLQGIGFTGLGLGFPRQRTSSEEERELGNSRPPSLVCKPFLAYRVSGRVLLTDSANFDASRSAAGIDILKTVDG